MLQHQSIINSNQSQARLQVIGRQLAAFVMVEGINTAESAEDKRQRLMRAAATVAHAASTFCSMNIVMASCSASECTATSTTSTVTFCQSVDLSTCKGAREGWTHDSLATVKRHVYGYWKLGSLATHGFQHCRKKMDINPQHRRDRFKCKILCLDRVLRYTMRAVACL